MWRQLRCLAPRKVRKQKGENDSPCFENQQSPNYEMMGSQTPQNRVHLPQTTYGLQGGLEPRKSWINQVIKQRTASHAGEEAELAPGAAALASVSLINCSQKYCLERWLPVWTAHTAYSVQCVCSPGFGSQNLNHLSLPFQGFTVPLWSLWAPAHMWHGKTHTRAPRYI